MENIKNNWLEQHLNTIVLGDSYELIKNIPDKTIDCIYTDIPYLLESYGKCNNECGIRFHRLMNESIDAISNGINYKIFDEFIRVMKKINIFIWCSKSQILDIMNYFINKGCRYEILVWCKTNPVPLANNSWLSDIEYCLYFREKNVRVNDGIKLKSKFYISPINKADKELYKHPTIKPLKQVEQHLKHVLKSGQIVLDPFCGSGTTCEAAKINGLNFIGIENNPKWHKIAVDRINGITADGQTSIFTDFEELGK